jgi:hypothetical protein
VLLAISGLGWVIYLYPPLAHRLWRIIDAASALGEVPVFQPEKPIRGKLVENCKLRYFNSFKFFDHTSFSLPRWDAQEGLVWPSGGSVHL